MLTTTDAGEDVRSNGNSRSTLVAMKNGATGLEDGLAVSYEAKHALSIQSSNRAPWYLPKKLKTTSTQKPANKCSRHLYS